MRRLLSFLPALFYVTVAAVEQLHDTHALSMGPEHSAATAAAAAGSAYVPSPPAGDRVDTGHSARALRGPPDAPPPLRQSHDLPSDAAPADFRARRALQHTARPTVPHRDVICNTDTRRCARGNAVSRDPRNRCRFRTCAAPSSGSHDGGAPPGGSGDGAGSSGCTVYAETQHQYFTPRYGFCYDLAGTGNWWDRKITWIRGGGGDGTTCLDVWEYGPERGGQYLQHCGAEWRELGYLQNKVSHICCGAGYY